MANPTPGTDVLIQVAADDGTGSPDTYADLEGMNSANFSPSRNMEDRTYFNNTDNTRKRFSGLKDGNLELSGDLIWDDTGQGHLRTAFENGDPVHVKILWDGTNGHEVTCLVENMSLESSAEGKNEVSFTCPFHGAPTVVP